MAMAEKRLLGGTIPQKQLPSFHFRMEIDCTSDTREFLAAHVEAEGKRPTNAIHKPSQLPVEMLHLLRA